MRHAKLIIGSYFPNLLHFISIIPKITEVMIATCKYSGYYLPNRCQRPKYSYDTARL